MYVAPNKYNYCHTPSSFALQWAKVGRQSLPTPSVTKYNKHWTFMFNYSLSNCSKKLDDAWFLMSPTGQVLTLPPIPLALNDL